LPLLHTPLPITSLPFSFNASAPPDIYTLSLHDALPIWSSGLPHWSSTTIQPALLRHLPDIRGDTAGNLSCGCCNPSFIRGSRVRSEEHTSELQSQSNLVCRLLLEKKKNKI